MSVDETAYMRRAIDLAKNGEGRVSPNPPVGCVLVKNGAVVGEGWHNRLGGLHAEAAALEAAGAAARGAVAYVTLAPCGSWGRQPPCADALIQAGVTEVVAAVEDPNPRNSSGLDVLRRAGVTVRTGLLGEEAEYLARGFFKVQRRRLPWVTLKYAMTLDGKIASSTGDSRWISGPESRSLVQDMRSRSDAVMVGSGTAMADNPLLNVREPTYSRRGGPAGHPQPLRVVVDSRCRFAPEAAIFQPENGPGGKILIAVAAEAVSATATSATAATAAAIAALERVGAEVLVFPPDAEGRVPLEGLLRTLAERGVNNILCEGGATLAAGLLARGLVDECAVFVAPKVIGGCKAPGPVGELGLARMADALAWTVRECRRVGDDIFIQARK